MRTECYLLPRDRDRGWLQRHCSRPPSMTSRQHRDQHRDAHTQTPTHHNHTPFLSHTRKETDVRTHTRTHSQVCVCGRVCGQRCTSPHLLPTFTPLHKTHKDNVKQEYIRATCLANRTCHPLPFLREPPFTRRPPLQVLS